MGKKLRIELILKDVIEELRSFKTAIIIFLTNIVLLVSVASIFYSVMNSNQNGYATNYKAVLYMYNNLILMEFIAILIITPINKYYLINRLIIYFIRNNFLIDR